MWSRTLLAVSFAVFLSSGCSSRTMCLVKEARDPDTAVKWIEEHTEALKALENKKELTQEDLTKLSEIRQLMERVNSCLK